MFNAPSNWKVILNFKVDTYGSDEGEGGSGNPPKTH